MLKDNPDVAAQYVESLVEDLYKISQESSATSANSNGTEATCTVPVKTQTKSNNCSAATILQTLYGLGKQSKVVGATDSAKQNTIFNNYTTNTSAPGARNPSSTDDTLTVSEVTVFLNKFVSTHKYQFKVGKSLSQPEFESLIWNSLVHNRPVLLHARTEFLEYYKGVSKKHYLSLDRYTKSTGKVRIKDCNYDKNYNGQHVETAERAYWCVNKIAGRYIISSN